ncbi:MAG TPA: DUF167 domain-containing protein [Methanomicrobiales archaeon]|nr:DUF167 domain-containing protein [Methanomicrobiales archaeon]
MEPFADAVTEDQMGVILALEVTPASERSSFFTGYDPWRKSIRCTVRSPPSKGKANREVIDSLAGALGVPAASVRILSGATQHRKRVKIEGISRADALGRLDRFL